MVQQPVNDNQDPNGLWEETPLGRKVMLGFSLVSTAAIWGGAYLWLDARGWTSVLIGIGLAMVSVFVSAIWRLIVHGRA